MDARHLDMLARGLATSGSRRRLLTLLATLPVVGGLAGLLEADDAAAKDRRRRRKQRHKRRKDPGKGKGKGQGKGQGKRGTREQPCEAEPVEQTCAGKCGTVTNTCKQPVDCGSCDCNPACTECFTCEGAAGSAGRCVPQSAGTPCGDAATCASGNLQPQDTCNGSGVCERPDPQPCTPYTQCAGDACATSCAGDADCVAGSYCDESGHCAGDQANGQRCDHGGQCASGFCVDEVCCDTACDGVCQTCALSGSAGTCTADADGATCGGGNVCCSGDCQECCTNEQCPSSGAPVCVAGSCELCGNPGGCPTPGQICLANGCVTCSAWCASRCPACLQLIGSGTICSGGISQCTTACTSDAECTNGQRCIVGWTYNSTNQFRSINQICNVNTPAGYCVTPANCPPSI